MDALATGKSTQCAGYRPPHADGAAMVSCLIVEDHDLVASGIERALEAASIDVAGRVTTLNDARSFPTGDVALLDLGLPDTCRLTAVESLRVSQPDLPILVLTATPDPVLAHICVAAGALGFFGKDIGTAALAAAVLRVAGGGLAIDPRRSPCTTCGNQTALTTACSHLMGGQRKATLSPPCPLCSPVHSSEC
jgi:DNA-binding NarL/FixJ family response regulator